MDREDENNLRIAQVFDQINEACKALCENQFKKAAEHLDIATLVCKHIEGIKNETQQNDRSDSTGFRLHI